MNALGEVRAFVDLQRDVRLLLGVHVVPVQEQPYLHFTEKSNPAQRQFSHKSQFLHKSVDLSSMITYKMNMLTDLCGA